MNKLKQLCNERGVLVAAHRGVCGANIPCNTIHAFEIAVRSGAQILEMDLFKSADGKIFIFHTGKETPKLGRTIDVEKLTSQEILQLRLYNADNNPTRYGLDSFDDVLEQFKGRCILNLDRCENFLEDVVRCVERHGMREQILLKSSPTEKHLNDVETYAPEYMYMPIYKNIDSASEIIEQRNINFVGAELTFADEDAPVAQQEYIDSMHAKGLALWSNSLIYNDRVLLSAGHNDDISLIENPENGWGWLVRRGFDIIQTDWTVQCAAWLKAQGFSRGQVRV